MKRIKLDRYVIYEKGRGYSYAMLRYAFALLASDLGKLVFFPCR